MSRRALAAFVLVSAFAPSARAWTSAAVRSVEAQVALAPDGSADVTLIAVVAVQGGWLEGLEIAGLDPDLALVDPPAWAIDAGGDRYAPRVEVLSGGRVSIAFP